MSLSNLDFPVSWDELHRTAKVLAHRLYDLPPFDGVVAITRGGLVPAAIVARELGIRMIDTVCVISYGAAEATETSEAIQGELQIVKSPNVPNDGDGWLIVDDLVDTGVTAKAVRKLLPKAHFATVYAKPLGKPMVDTFVTEVSQDTWIHFPWDLAPQPIAPISRSRVL